MQLGGVHRSTGRKEGRKEGSLRNTFYSRVVVTTDPGEILFIPHRTNLQAHDSVPSNHRP